MTKQGSLSSGIVAGTEPLSKLQARKGKNKVKSSYAGKNLQSSEALT
jgi:hypothetical protein